jgi:chromosome segregation ATPase
MAARSSFLFVIAAGLIPLTLLAQPALPRWPSLEGGGAYVLFMDNGITVVNGTAREYERSKALRKSPQEQLFWFQSGGREYVIRDAATLKRLQDVFQPQMLLGQQQPALAEKQARLSDQQTALGAQQAQQGAVQADFAERMNTLASEQARLQEQGENTEAVEAEIQGLEQEMGRYEEPQAELIRQQEEITRQQEFLLRQQEDLGRKMEKAAQNAEKLLKPLLDQAIAKGTAKAVK